ncbi:MAG TPA: biosynthetic peptidoglycan transglycosylase, partial [Anaeromyxobacter sp.]
MPAGRSVLRVAALGSGGAVLAAVSLAAGLWVALPDPARLARDNPRTTALIEQRRAEARATRRAFRPRQTWIAPERIAPALVQAVLISEDANFFGHEGIDWEAIRGAAEHDLKVRRFARGASTLTQQLARNLWLGTEKSLWRKAKEAVLAAKLERALSKKRILSLYLNLVEMDDGVFGVEAGARQRFGTSAAALSPAQAAVLASLLPAPRRVDLGHPSSWLKGRSRRLLDRMRDHGRLTPEEHRAASAELERILAGPSRDEGEEPPEDEQAQAAPAPPGAGTLAVRPVSREPPAGAEPEPGRPPGAAAQNGAAGTAG